MFYDIEGVLLDTTVVVRGEGRGGPRRSPLRRLPDSTKSKTYISVGFVATVPTACPTESHDSLVLRIQSINTSLLTILEPHVGHTEFPVPGTSRMCIFDPRWYFMRAVCGKGGSSQVPHRLMVIGTILYI